jgi:hypothetical protein
VAEDHGILQNERANPPLLPVVDIAATDSRVVYGNEDIVRRFDLGLWSLFESDVVGFVEDEGEVLRGD